MKKFASVILLLLFVISLAACGNSAGSASSSTAAAPAVSTPAAPAEKETINETETNPIYAVPGSKKYLSIATASLGGSYYPIGVGMSEIFNKYIDNLEVSVEVTGGAAENPKLVGAGDSDLGFTNANLAYAAYNGTGAYKGNAYKDLRVMFSGVAPGTIHLVTLESSGINEYADLKGKKVAVGPQGGGLLSLLPDLLGEYNMTMEDLKSSYMSFDEGVQAVIDGHLDAAFVQAPHPSSAVKTIQNTNVKFKLIEVSDDVRKNFLSKYPYYNSVDIPKAVYNTDHDIKTIGTTNVVVINANVDPELVYYMLKSMYNDLDYLYEVHASAKSIKVETGFTDMIPMHDGAVKFFTEAGVK